MVCRNEREENDKECLRQREEVGTKEKKTTKSAYEKRRGRHEREESNTECLRQREEVGTQKKKTAKSAYDKEKR